MRRPNRKPIKVSRQVAAKAQERIAAAAQKPPAQVSLFSGLDENLLYLQSVWHNASDVVVRRFSIRGPQMADAALVYLEGLVNTATVNDLLRSLMLNLPAAEAEMGSERGAFRQGIIKVAVGIGQVKEVKQMDQLLDGVSCGETALLVDGLDSAWTLETRGWQMRAIDEPTLDTVVRGPREGFVETLRVNISLIRRRVRSTNLKVETMKIGSLTETDVSLVWIEGIANPKVLAEARRRLKRIQTDAILETGYLQEYIQDQRFAVFPTMRITDRPDKVAAQILEGRVALLVDGTPIALTFPMIFWEIIQSAEDYYDQAFVMSLFRLIRLFSLLLALVLPAFYVAAVSYHQEMIPMPLALSIAAGRSRVPFPAVIEAVVMGLAFEILREGGVRLPKQVGQAVSIVGVLVIGQAAVSAGFVSPIMIIITALTALASFAIPNYSVAIALAWMRFALVLMAGALGLYGLVWGLLALFIHLLSLRSFGAPYFSPQAPVSFKDWKDSLIRLPWWAMRTRPRVIGWQELRRQEAGLKPQPPPKRRG